MRHRGSMCVVIAVIVATLVAGCASIPSSGGVHRGGPVTQVNDPLDLDFNPAPPEKDATPERIVQGFINAASSPKNNYQIAREYLTRTLTATWNPDASVTIDDGRNRTYSHQGNYWNLATDPLATVDSQGSYSTALSSTPIALNYQLIQQDGQWRISTAPDGILIDSLTFQAVFSQQTLYFYSLDSTYLVPDVRWFPARVASEATRIVAAVLSGPAPWLTGAVINAFPVGTQLAVPSVITTNGVAQVNLSTEATRASSIQLQRMQWELQKSLNGIAQSVAVSIEGNEQQISQLTGDGVPQQDPQISANPIVSRGGSFGLVNGSTISDFPGISQHIVALQPSAVTINAARDQAAAFSRGIVYLVTRTADPIAVDSRPGLIAPSFDNQGFVWSVPANDPGALQVASARSGAHQIATAWPTAATISAFAVSRDGTRLAAVIATNAGNLLALSGIVRDGSGSPTGIVKPLLIPLGSGAPSSLSWSDDVTVDVLTSLANGATSISSQTIAGQSTILTGPSDGQQIVGAGSSVQYYVLSAGGLLQSPAGIGWQTQLNNVSAVAVQLGQP